MPKLRGLFWIVPIAAFAAAAVGGAATGNPGPGVPRAVADHVAARGSASVIVGLDVPVVSEGRLDGPRAVGAQRRRLAAALEDVVARATGAGIEVGGRFETIPFFTARVGPGELSVLAGLPGVASIHENEMFSAELLQSVPLVNAPGAWAMGATGSGWSVAILDTGVDKSHPFLGGKIISEACYSGAGGSAPPGFSSICPGGVFASTAVDSGVPCTAEPLCAHGTAAAGIAAGIHDPSGLVGVAHGANLISIQVTTRVENCIPGGIPCLMFFESDLIRALERVATLAGPGNANRVAAVSSSVGSGRFLSQAACDTWLAPIKAAIDHLRSMDIPVIFPSGNDGHTDGISAPACISTAVSAGATTKTDTLAAYTSRAPFLSLVAPGGDGTLSAGGIITSIPGGVFGIANGSSFAVPHVAGAWSILKQAVPGASVSRVVAALRGAGAPISDAAAARVYPRIDVEAARQVLLTGPAGPPGAPGAPEIAGGGNFLSIRWPAPASGGVPSAYTLRARLAQGGPVVASVPLGDIQTLDVTAPSGTFVLSVQAGNASGFGPESASRTISVPFVPPPPGAPSGLAAIVAGTSVHLFWTPPPTGGDPLGYLVVAALSPGGPPIASVAIAAPAWWTTIPGVPPGTYYLRLAAFNLGGVSTLSNEVAVTVSQPALPGAPTMHAPLVSGHTVSLSWTPGPGGVPTSYIVRAALSPTGPVVASLPTTATSIAVPSVPSGTYFVRVQAVSGAGVGPESNQVTVVVP